MSKKWHFVDLSSIKDSSKVIELYEINGAGQTLTKINGPRFCTADIAIPNNSFPVKRPIEGCVDNRSYWKTNFLRVQDWDGFAKHFGCSAISDISIFPTEESVFGPCNLIADKWQLSRNGVGGVLIGQNDTGEHGISTKDYTQATGILGVTGDPIKTHHRHYSMQTVPVRKIDCYSQAKPCVIDRSIYSGPFESKAWITQLVVPSTAVFGQKKPIEFHFGAKIMSQ